MDEQKRNLNQSSQGELNLKKNLQTSQTAKNE